MDKHLPGRFCRVELATADQPAAKAFYASLFGWEHADSPMGPNNYYTIFMLAGRNAAACYTLREDEVKLGVPPHWNLYIAVASADETTKRAADCGGSVFCGPFDVSTHGRMSTIADPTGAVFSIWEAKNHPGLGIEREHASYCRADLSTPDPVRAAQFYAEVFEWTMRPGDIGYQHIGSEGEEFAGIPPASFLRPIETPHWQICFQVDDCDAATDRAKELGALIYTGPTSVEHVGRMTVLADPQGAIFSLFQPFPN
jgi:predicted enzyme related to lactoylglutathione lyase